MPDKWLFAIFVFFQLGLSFESLTDITSKDTWQIGRYNACPRLRLQNGKIRIRGRGRIAKFVCLPTFDMVGKRFATCVRGQWTNSPPVCVAPGCDPQPITNGYFISLHQNAFLNYFCDAGYKLIGSNALYCDGRFWNSTVPTCTAASKTPSLSCDFESNDLCGWSHSDSNEFTWTRHHLATPSGHVGTGPSHDHTFGESKDGYYMYIEGSSPRKENDTARLISPVYDGQLSNGCFVFWYHMYGATTGFLLVYMKNEPQSLDLLIPSFYKARDQGNKWHRGVVPLTPTKENFQIIIEGVRGVSYVSDTAIDDVKLTYDPTECVDGDNDITTVPTTDPTTTQPILPPDTTTMSPEIPSTETVTSTSELPTTTSTTLETTTTDTTTPTPSTMIWSSTPLPTTQSSTTTYIPTTTTTPTSTSSTTTTTSTPATTSSTTTSTTSSIKTSISMSSTKETSGWGTLPPKPIFPSKSTTTKAETVQPPQKHKKEESGGLSTAGGVGIIVVTTLVIAVIIGGIYWVRRKHEVARQKLSDDSDIRYLKDDEIHIDFTEARPEVEII